MTQNKSTNKTTIRGEEKRWSSKGKGKWSNSHKKENSSMHVSKPKQKLNDFSSLFLKGGIGLFNPKQRPNSKHN